MKKEIARKKMESKGYKVITLMQGGYMAKKNNQTYKANSITGLFKLIFG